MLKWIRRILIVIMLAVFVYSAANILLIRHRYKVSEQTYSQAVNTFTRPAAAAPRPSPEGGDPASPGADAPAVPGENDPPSEAHDDEHDAQKDRAPVYAPIAVDFDALLAINSEIVGWIYCEDTVINYPVVWGRDNNFYLERDYRGQYDGSGTIFTNADNLMDWSDANVILYGHHMQNMTMFAPLKYWLEQDFFDQHPIMWLLTPGRDYRVELFSAYVTPADSDSYRIFHDHGEDYAEYLQRVCGRSRIQSPVVPEVSDQCLMLSTCAYEYELARTVLHGRLVPLDSAGGVPIDWPAAA